MVDNSVLDTTTENAAAQQENVDNETLCFSMCHHKSDQTVVAKSVPNLYAQNTLPISGTCPEFCFSLAQRREIKLISALGELRQSRPVAFFRGAYLLSRHSGI